MECIDIASKYLHPAFVLTMIVSIFSLWRMKANAIEGYQAKFKQFPLWRQLIGDFVIPKSLLTERGKRWYSLGTIGSVGLVLVAASYIYFGKQEWVCKWGPEKPTTEIIKNVFKGS